MREVSRLCPSHADLGEESEGGSCGHAQNHVLQLVVEDEVEALGEHEEQQQTQVLIVEVVVGE